MGVGEGEFRDCMEAEEGGTADDGDDDEGWQAGGVLFKELEHSVSRLLYEVFDISRLPPLLWHQLSEISRDRRPRRHPRASGTTR